MEIPGLGKVTEDDGTGWLFSGPVSVPVLDGSPCEIALEGYLEDGNKEDFHAAIQNFLSITPDVLKAVQDDLYRYYQDCNSYWAEEDEEYLAIASPSELWKHVHFGFEPLVSRRSKDGLIYISLSCNCDWEPEHGLQIVFKNGSRVNKLGPYDGHLTHSDAYARDEFEESVYR